MSLEHSCLELIFYYRDPHILTVKKDIGDDFKEPWHVGRTELSVVVCVAQSRSFDVRR